MGRPLFRSVASMSGDACDAFSSNILPTGDVLKAEFVAPSTQSIGGTGGSSPADFDLEPMALWVPGCDEFSGAYASIGCVLVIEVTADSNVVAAD